MSDQQTVTPLDLANAIRALSMDAVQAAKSGHPGMPMGMADAATILFTRHLKFDSTDGHWPDRDRFVLSAGHGSMLLYALLHLTGYAEMTMDELRNFRQMAAKTAGHPEFGHCPGIETTTGPLGQGLANAVGMAIAERHLAARFGDGIVDHHTYVIAGDGCLMEGISHEAASLAGHLKLAKLIVLFDDNHISIDGPTDLSTSDDSLARFRAYGWSTMAVDGHDGDAIDAAIGAAKASDRPVLIACRTLIGKGSPAKQGTAAAHGAPLGDDEISKTRDAIGWPHPPFEIPDAIRQAWLDAGMRSQAVHQAWQARLQALDPAAQAEFHAAMGAELPDGFDGVVRAHVKKLLEDRPAWATRKASQEALEVITEAASVLVGGSADLTGSNNTKTKATLPMTPDNWAGRYLYYGVREHAMMSAMNGMALHGGVIPYGGTFLVFSDYCRPAIRLAALMGQRVILVATHDSIGLGEDGPTHQPVEHVASLRAMPNCLVMRPADAVETTECWQAALENRDGPTVMALSRQSAPLLRTDDGGQNLSALGGYIISDCVGDRAATIIATGTEVAVAVDAQKQLAEQGVHTAVVSMPCMELFERQDAGYRNSVLGTAPRVAVEAAVAFGWTRYVESEDDVIGLRGFGASAPAKELYQHFGIDAASVVARVNRKMAARR